MSSDVPKPKPCPNPWCQSLLKPSVEEGESEVYITCCVDGPPRMSYAEAITAWNTRPAEAALEARINALESEVRTIEFFNHNGE